LRDESPSWFALEELVGVLEVEYSGVKHVGFKIVFLKFFLIFALFEIVLERLEVFSHSKPFTVLLKLLFNPVLKGVHLLCILVLGDFCFFK
jgi:hypothetical protein